MKKKQPLKVIIPIAAAVLLGIAVFIAFYTLYNRRTVPVNPEGYEADEEASEEADINKGIKNIVFLGIDQEENRSDVMMVISINAELRTVNVTSLLRDTRVEIDGHAPTKLGYAYKWGGAELALKTINKNFGTAFDRYICMDFKNLADIIYSIGGVGITLTQEEADRVNDYAQATGYTNWDAVAGWNVLNGDQAVAYSRIRNIDSEYARAGRQQTVIKAMLESVKQMSAFQYPALINMILNGLETNLSYGELFALSPLASGDITLITHTVPDANYETDLFGGWVLNPDGGPEEDPVQWLWIYDLKAAGTRLKKIMYDPSYWEDPDLPFAPWEWNELEDVIGGTDIDISSIDIEDVPVYIPPEPETTHGTADETTQPQAQDSTDTIDETITDEMSVTTEEDTAAEPDDTEKPSGDGNGGTVTGGTDADTQETGNDTESTEPPETETTGSATEETDTDGAEQEEEE